MVSYIYTPALLSLVLTIYIPFRNNDFSWKQRTLCIYSTSLSRYPTSTILPPFSLILTVTANLYFRNNDSSWKQRKTLCVSPTSPPSSSVYYYHPQHCYTINTSTTDVSVYCSGHHPDCTMENHQKTSGCSS